MDKKKRDNYKGGKRSLKKRTKDGLLAQDRESNVIGALHEAQSWREEGVQLKKGDDSKLF